MSRFTRSLLAAVAGSILLGSSAQALAPHGTNWPLMPATRKAVYLSDKAASGCPASAVRVKAHGSNSVRAFVYRPHP